MNNSNNFFKKNGFSIALCSFIAIAIVASIYFSYNNFTNENKQLAKSEEEPYLEPVNKSDVKSYKETETLTESSTSIKQNENKQSLNETTTKKEETSTEPATESTTKATNNSTSAKQDDKVFSLFDDEQEMSWPVFGNIVSKFDMTTSVYDKTLDQYKVSDSICIAAPVGTDVKATAEGIVENIFVDDELGQTVSINHGNGWVSTYSQLEENVSVSVGDIVDEGQIIGKVSNPSKYGVALGSHLDFKVLKDDTPKDPTEVLTQQNE
ncbi:M23 family metallopeptidase [uncultured Tyzzerella sp.]|uniref:M23 family metallopeptidase n=1 Tax=uncultured Tyzzerella sp. TaxID=2321398 RepID=UPI002943EB43|nr:M23 family metallopeptidase [uncultured Tyzzerella sp.]